MRKATTQMTPTTNFDFETVSEAKASIAGFADEAGSHLDKDAHPHGKRLAVSGCDCSDCRKVRIREREPIMCRTCRGKGIYAGLDVTCRSCHGSGIEPLAAPPLVAPVLRSLTEVQLDAAIERWEARFINRVIDCDCFRGYRGAEGDVPCRVVGCRQGEIETALCVRCDKPESGREECECNAEDFLTK